VTVLFSDLVGSTSLGESMDSESLRELLHRYFEGMQSVLERNGGAVEKFIGDAIMAVFGLPKLREDDALRAVTAAIEMQEALAVLNEELERGWGVRLANRTGVNTGEVVAGDVTAGQRLVTGDTVNVAARLEQAAGTGEVLLGDLTYRLVRDAVEVDVVARAGLPGARPHGGRLVRRTASGAARRPRSRVGAAPRYVLRGGGGRSLQARDCIREPGNGEVTPGRGARGASRPGGSGRARALPLARTGHHLLARRRDRERGRRNPRGRRA
jgi:class 3 adenylate cyclase